jgi:hypothetical protein
LVFDIHHGAYLMAHISTIINIDAIFTINIDAQCGCATTNKFDADQFVAQASTGAVIISVNFCSNVDKPTPRHKKRA